jgi:hypothetical protein
MKFKTLILTMLSDQVIKEDPAKLRGFFSNEFNNYVLLHQHKDNEFIYRYPLVQYKIIDNIPIVVGIQHGVEVLKEIYNKYHSIKLGSHAYEIVERTISVQEQEFGTNHSLLLYTFLTPWLALNEKNYEKYQKYGTWVKRKELLEKILVGNIISMSKSLGYTVPEPIKVNIHRLKEVQTSLKGTPMLGFLGTFSVNFKIPDYWGIGKSVSRGFGTVVRTE